MTWVMVPVPEELVPRVSVLLYQLEYGSCPQWTEALLDDHLLSLADEPRAVVSEVAAGVLDGQPIEDVELAGQLQVSVREVFGLVGEANHFTVGTPPGDLILTLHEEMDDGAGGMRRRRVLCMLEGVAQIIHNRGEDDLGLRRPSSPEG